MTEMSKAESGRFLIQGTFTGKLATVKKHGSSHVFQFGLYWMMGILVQVE
jgi:PPOX class probable F420-dependent enzyme